MTSRSINRIGGPVARSAPGDEAVHAAIVSGLPAGAAIDSLTRRVSPYASSFAVEEIDAVLSDGREVALVFKDAGSMLDSARRPDAVGDPRREIEVYREVLAKHDFGTPRLHEAVVDEEIDRYWLFIERVNGPLLWQCAGLEAWLETARWLARMHSSVGIPATSIQRRGGLSRFDPASMDRLLHRAREVAGAGAVPLLDELGGRCASISETLGRLPASFTHGDFFPANVIVANSLRICPVDWEMAAVGPSLLDLAALTAGRWADAERRAIAAAYFEALEDADALYGDFESLMRGLAACRISLAVRMLGWAPDWTPPAEQRNDWLQEAHDALGELDP
jgi:aminoglycoside phosphotransferase (APT) family kinase protein